MALESGERCGSRVAAAQAAQALGDGVGGEVCHSAGVRAQVVFLRGRGWIPTGELRGYHRGLKSHPPRKTLDLARRGNPWPGVHELHAPFIYKIRLY
jgi:hypothetical protein